MIVTLYITTDGQSASVSWNKAPVWGLWPDFYYCQTVVGLLMWGALSDERTGLYFTMAPGPRQRNYFRVRVPWDSWPYFTVPDSRLSFSSPPTTRRATVEVFDPASTRETKLEISGLALHTYSHGTDQRTENTVLLLSHVPRHHYVGSPLALVCCLATSCKHSSYRCLRVSRCVHRAVGWQWSCTVGTRLS
jgi:hypothetical protein